ncbi:MAG: NAD-dependent epimerase/dehydratase [Betaproteobacteria bacterium TMED156]|nr:MAG: NAD-dependent epimerase/dehydratase [Betaproteobacteria bacterium TMED156]
MKILVTGGCGYKGHVLVPKLLEKGHEVVVIDTMWFGNFLEPSNNLSFIKADLRDKTAYSVDGIDKVIHLASVANDPCADLDPVLTWEVSTLATLELLIKCKKSNVRQFIYASSGSVYGVKTEPHVTEELDLVPISAYNKTKMVAERLVLNFAESFNIQIIRPATVCGLSPRMRLDVAVNLLTAQAFKNGLMTVLGGSQVRPNIHIEDITDLYVFFLGKPNLTGIFNAGFENISILDIAEQIAKLSGAKIEIEASNDPRSYRLDSSKLLKTGFTPKFKVADAINQVFDALNQRKLEDNDRCYNLKWMNSIREKINI